MLKLKKKIHFLLMIAVIIPGLIIALLGVYLVSHQKNARLLDIKDEFNRRLRQIQTRVEDQIRQRIDAVYKQVEGDFSNFSDTQVLLSHLKAIVLKNPIVKYPFFINSQSKFLFPISQRNVILSAHSPALEVDKLNIQGPAKDFYLDGYQTEYRQRDFIRAVKYYLKSLDKNPDFLSVPYIYNSIGRCYYKLNLYPQAIHYYYKILLLNKKQIRQDRFLYLTVLRQLAFSYSRMELTDEAIKYYLQVYEEVQNNEPAVQTSSGTFSFFKNEALEYLNRFARKDSLKMDKEHFYASSILEQLRNKSKLEISLQWLYFDLEGPDNRDRLTKGDNEFKFSRFRDLFETNDEKSQFYKAVKGMKQWRGIEGSLDKKWKVEVLKIENPSSFRPSPIEIVFHPLSVKSPGNPTIFFGYMLFVEFIEQDIILPTAQKYLDDPQLFSEVLDVSNTNSLLVAVPLQKFLRGKKLALNSNKGDYFGILVNRELRLYYILLGALVLSFALGIFLFYKYLSREAELIRLKAQFVDGASHTLKTPLTRISLLAENIKQGWVTGQSQKEHFFDTIISETGRMNEMIDNMLNFSRIEAGKQHYELEKIYLQEIVISIIERHSHDLKKFGFKVELEIGDHLPALMADPKAIRLIIGNLLQNAVKYSLQNKYIKVCVFKREEFMIFSIEDKGIGVPKKQLTDIPGNCKIQSSIIQMGQKG